ncbi:TspO/MBR family protein [Amycolatopsis azurea]|uniref:Tryptophan-rich sensory protein n=1 Tax=Amycolatopsis azurea DSM 43854 TaxID=1238180 RepID=M2P1U0_9PSEU|nr:TspO/MBR family protein [Amycolatopsis azurea]EMD29059.1 tryptophan-rich sensory protein [Amycolatopsis azurea DSM 43854]OOC05173.1 tryptophan-rich sensory protein [Amycolatopsis azurea DSM 43854]
MSTVPSPPTHHRRLRWQALAGFVALSAIVGAVAALAVATRPEAQDLLVRPSWAPPGWLYGPVWSALLLVVAVAGWCYWRTDGETRGFAFYGLCLLLTLLWTPLFFAGSAHALALADVVVLDFVVPITMMEFGRRSRLAAWLLVPYLLWLLFSTAVNAAVVWLN